MKIDHLLLACLTSIILFTVACNSGGKEGTVAIDGSSTVYPLTEAVAEEFMAETQIRVTVGVSGTGGGFQKFIRGDIDINNASREIKSVEANKLKENNIEYQQLSVALDGIAIVIHPDNDWVETITVEELKKIWGPGAQGNIETWNQIRPEWPNQPLRLYGAGTASGTFDYFTEAIMGETGASRGDYTSSEDDNILVQGISSDIHAMGFFGIAYYEENKDKLKVVAVDNGDGPVLPTMENINSNKYAPLSRPLFIYVRKESAQRPTVRQFVTYYLNNARDLAESVGYIALPDEEYKTQIEKFREFAGSEKAATAVGEE